MTVPGRIFLRNVEWGFLSEGRRKPTFLEGFILGAAVFALPGIAELAPAVGMETDLDQKRRKLQILINVLYEESGLSIQDQQNKLEEKDIFVDVNIQKFDGGFFDSYITDLTNFRGEVDVEYRSFWALSSKPLAQNVVNIRKFIPSESISNLINKIYNPFLTNSDIHPSELAMANMFLQGLSEMVREIKEAANPTLSRRLFRWWKDRK